MPPKRLPPEKTAFPVVPILNPPPNKLPPKISKQIYFSIPVEGVDGNKLPPVEAVELKRLPPVVLPRLPNNEGFFSLPLPSSLFGLAYYLVLLVIGLYPVKVPVN